MFLPIDAKFPQEDYVRLQQAYEQGHLAEVETAQKALNISVKKFAKDIQQKYIDPPNTTDFGIMFLPFEGSMQRWFDNPTSLPSSSANTK